jgi:hypothetical protein
MEVKQQDVVAELDELIETVAKNEMVRLNNTGKMARLLGVLIAAGNQETVERARTALDAWWHLPTEPGCHDECNALVRAAESALRQLQPLEIELDSPEYYFLTKLVDTTAGVYLDDRMPWRPQLREGDTLEKMVERLVRDGFVVRREEWNDVIPLDAAGVELTRLGLDWRPIV